MRGRQRNPEPRRSARDRGWADRADDESLTFQLRRDSDGAARITERHGHDGTVLIAERIASDRSQPHADRACRFSQPLAPPFLASSNADRRDRRGGHRRCGGGAEDERPPAMSQEVHERPRPARERTGSSKCLAQRTDGDLGPALEAPPRCGASSFSARHSDRVRIIEHQPRAETVRERDEPVERRTIAVHGVDPLRDDQGAPGDRAVGDEHPLERVHVAMRHDADPRLRQPASIDQRCVRQRIGVDDVALAHERGDHRDVRRITAREQECRLRSHELRQGVLQLDVQWMRARDEPRRA